MQSLVDYIPTRLRIIKGAADHHLDDLCFPIRLCNKNTLGAPIVVPLQQSIPGRQTILEHKPTKNRMLAHN